MDKVKLELGCDGHGRMKPSKGDLKALWEMVTLLLRKPSILIAASDLELKAAADLEMKVWPSEDVTNSLSFLSWQTWCEMRMHCSLILLSWFPHQSSILKSKQQASYLIHKHWVLPERHRPKYKYNGFMLVNEWMTAFQIIKYGDF